MRAAMDERMRLIEPRQPKIKSNIVVAWRAACIMIIIFLCVTRSAQRLQCDEKRTADDELKCEIFVWHIAHASITDSRKDRGSDSKSMRYCFADKVS